MSSPRIKNGHKNTPHSMIATVRQPNAVKREHNKTECGYSIFMDNRIPRSVSHAPQARFRLIQSQLSMKIHLRLEIKSVSQTVYYYINFPLQSQRVRVGITGILQTLSAKNPRQEQHITAPASGLFNCRSGCPPTAYSTSPNGAAPDWKTAAAAGAFRPTAADSETPDSGMRRALNPRWKFRTASRRYRPAFPRD